MNPNGTDENITVLPVVEERLSVSKRTRESRRTRLVKSVRREQTVIDEPLMRRTHEITRVPVDQVVDRVGEPRQEGDTLIIPVYEERAVVEKRLVLVEEIHIKRRYEEYHDPKQIELLKESVAVDEASGEE